MRRKAALSLLAVFFARSVFDFAAAAVENKPLPVYASKPAKDGLFPEELISMKELRAKQTKKEKFILFDARGKDSYDTLHIKGAVLPLSADYYRKEWLFKNGIVKNSTDRDADLAESMKKYPQHAPIVTYCNDHCQAGAILLLKIKRLGFDNVRALDGGIQTWQASGYPTASGFKQET